MSLINVWLSPERALIACDTEAKKSQTGQFFEASKMLFLPHAGTIFALRGNNVVLTTLYVLASQEDVVGFDALCRALPLLLTRTWQFVGPLLTSSLPAERVHKQELIVCGHSRAARRICCKLFRLGGPQIGFEESDVEDPGYVGCWDLSWGNPPQAVGTIAAMASLAQTQVANSLVRYPNEAIGGRLLVAELTANKVEFSTIEPFFSRINAAH